MSDALLLGIIGAAAAALVPASTFVGVWLERRVKHKTAEAALETAHAATDTAEAALESAHTAATTAQATAEAAVQDAFTRAYEAASKNWAVYNEAQQRWNESQSRELSKLSERQAQTEMQLEASKIRADSAEHLYAVALIYLRRIASWVNEHWPGEVLPPPPPELESEILGYGSATSPYTSLIAQVGKAAREQAHKDTQDER